MARSAARRRRSRTTPGTSRAVAHARLVRRVSLSPPQQRKHHQPNSDQPDHDREQHSPPHRQSLTPWSVKTWRASRLASLAMIQSATAVTASASHPVVAAPTLPVVRVDADNLRLDASTSSSRSRGDRQKGAALATFGLGAKTSGAQGHRPASRITAVTGGSSRSTSPTRSPLVRQPRHRRWVATGGSVVARTRQDQVRNSL